MPDDEFDVIRDVRCQVDDPVHLPMDGTDHKNSFDLLLQMDGEARVAIREKNDYVMAYAKKMQTGSVRNDFVRVSDEIKNVVTDAENISEEDGEAVYGVLDSGYARPWTDKLKEFLMDFKRDKSVGSLVFKIKGLGNDMGMEAPKESGGQAEPQGEPGLKLVGAMLIIGDKFDARHADNTLERYFTLNSRI